MLNRLIGSIFLIAGTSIGAGMLGLPIKMLGIDFKINVIIFIISWCTMIMASVFMMEISSWIKDDSNIISISKNIVNNKFSKIIAILYIFFLYSLTTAYIAGGSTMIMDLMNIKKTLISNIIFTLPFAIIIFLGINVIDQINKIFFLILLAAYIILSLKIKNVSNLNIINFNFIHNKIIIFSLPIIITSFGYNLLIPSIKIYLLNNKKSIIIAILIGSTIPLITYIIWEYIILCYFSEIGNKLFTKILFGKGNPTEKIIILMSNNKPILYSISFFSFFALASSLIGVALSIYDFFFDLLNIKKNIKKNKIIVMLLIFTIPLIINIINPYGFMFALNYAGAFASILLIIFPTYILWYGQYIKKIKIENKILKSKIILSFILYIGTIIIFIDIVEKFYF